MIERPCPFPSAGWLTANATAKLHGVLRNLMTRRRASRTSGPTRANRSRSVRHRMRLPCNQSIPLNVCNRTPKCVAFSASTQAHILKIQMTERLENRTLARVPKMGEIRRFFCGFRALFGHLRENRRGQRRSAAASAFSAETSEPRAATAPGPPAAPGRAWRTCASRACGSCFPGGPPPRPPRGRSCLRPTAPPPGSPFP